MPVDSSTALLRDLAIIGYTFRNIAQDPPNQPGGFFAQLLFSYQFLVYLFSNLVGMVLCIGTFGNPMAVLPAQVKRFMGGLNRFGLVLILADLVDPVKYRVVIGKGGCFK